VGSAQQPSDLVGCLKRVAAALRDGGVPFALGGGLAAWARGGPPSEHDVDLLIHERHREQAHEVLAGAGYRTEIPPEGWLIKAFDGDILIDLIYRPSGLDIDEGYIERCEQLSVSAVTMPVMSVDDLVVTKLLALTEHHLDFGRVLEVARALREQVDWNDVRRRTEHSPFARAFFTLIRELGIVDPVTERAGA
jgi:hypothetical protein